MRRRLLVVCLGALLLLPACAPSSPTPSPTTDAGARKDAVVGPGIGTPGTEPGTDRTDLPADAQPAALSLTVTPAPAVGLDLVRVANDAFTIELPAGWTWETVGEYTSFGIRAYDPANACRQMFFYSKMEPLIKSEAARAIYQASADAIAGPSYAQMYADAPVLSPTTTEQFFTVFDEYTAFARAYGIEHTFTSLADLEIVETLPLQTPIADYTVDDAVVRGLFTAAGLPCEGLFGASVFDSGAYEVQGVDASPLSVYNIMGIAAPGDEFAALEGTLARSLASFAYTDAYVQAAQQNVAEETGTMLAYAETMSAAYDSYNAAWARRQTTYDAVSQQRSDAAGGYERVYDPATGEVYRAEAGFYEAYDAARAEYSNSGLRLVPPDGAELWSRPIDGYVSG